MRNAELQVQFASVVAVRSAIVVRKIMQQDMTAIFHPLFLFLFSFLFFVFLSLMHRYALYHAFLIQYDTYIAIHPEVIVLTSLHFTAKQQTTTA